MKETTTNRLRQLIAETGLKQVEILEKSKPFQKELDVKMGKSALSQYISGKSNPDQDKLVLLAKTFGVSEAWLLGFDVPREPFGANIIHGDNHGVNSLAGGNGNTNTYNFSSNDNINNHNESMKALSVADVKMSRALVNAQNETVKKLDRIIELLEEQNRILSNTKAEK
jgi:transcriptional regulator with XRE-family HTH domain